MNAKEKSTQRGTLVLAGRPVCASLWCSQELEITAEEKFLQYLARTGPFRHHHTVTPLEKPLG